MNRYTVEYNNKRYVIEGDKEPTEADMANIVGSEQPDIQPETSIDNTPTGIQKITEPLKQYGIGLAEGVIDEFATPKSSLKVASQMNPLFKPLELGMTKVPAVKGKSLSETVEDTREELREHDKPDSLGLQSARLAGYITPMLVSGRIARAMQVKNPKYLYKKSTTAVNKATDEYRALLRPTKGEIKNIEIRSGKDINKFYRLAAEEGIPVKTGADNKLNTLEAVEHINERQKPIHDKIQQLLRSNSKKQIPFDLYRIGSKAKKELQKMFKNAKEYEAVSKMVDDYIESEVNRYGSRFLTGEQINNVKRGMWSVGYDMLKPSSDKVARKIGFIIKETIENAYPKTQIKVLNKLSGDLATLSNLLRNAHGRVIQGGKVGRYVARGIGAMSLSKIPVAGPIVGAKLGDKFSQVVTSPERMSKNAVKLMNNSKLYKKILINKINKNPNIKKTSQAVTELVRLLGITKKEAMDFIGENYGKLRA